MTRDAFAAFMGDLAREFAKPHSGKWEWWVDGRKRRRTIAVRLCPDSSEVSVAHRAVGTDGCMGELDAFACDLEHLPKLIHSLQRACAVAQAYGLIKPSKE